MTKTGVHYFFKRQNDTKVLKHTVLTDDLSLGFNDALQQAMSKGWKVRKPIPTALIYPFDAEAVQDKVSRFKEKNENDVRIVYEDVLAQSFLKGAGKNVENHDYIILNNQGDGTEMFFYKSEGKSQLSLMPEMNYANGWERLNDYLIGEFAKEGLVLGTTQEKQLMEQVRKNNKGGTYRIKKDNGNIHIEASIQLTKEKYEDKLSEKRSQLSRYLHPKILQASPQLKEIFVVGEYFDNQVIQAYLQKDLELSAFLKKENYLDLRDIVHYASAIGFDGVNQFLIAEKAEEDRIAQLRKKRQAKADRIYLLQQIRETVTEPEKIEEYKQIFGKKADELGIPKEVVIWNIEEIVDTLELERQLGEKHEIPVVSSSNIEKIITKDVGEETPAPTPKPQPQAASKLKEENEKQTAAPSKSIPSTPESKPKPKTKKIVKTAQVSNTASAAEEVAKFVKTIKELRPAVGFHAQLCELSNQPGEEKILRYITNEQLKDKQLSASFQQLHDVESAYYENTSPIHSTNFGKYYFREAMEGEPLPAYVTKNKSRFHTDVNKWSNTDLKLLLKIWKEVEKVDKLDYHFEIDAGDIVVLTKRTWSLKKEVDVKIVSFKAKEVTAKEMKQSMHQVLSELLGKEVYAALREKFSM